GDDRLARVRPRDERPDASGDGAVPGPLPARRRHAARLPALGHARLADPAARRVRRAELGVARGGSAPRAQTPRLRDRPAAVRLLAAPRPLHARALDAAD